MNLKWNKDLETGIIWQDDQHKALLETLSNLYNAMDSGTEKARLEKALDFLKEYAVKHFFAEEKAMEVNSFPDIAEHRTEHGHFMNKLEELIKEHRTLSSPKLLLKTERFLIEWLFEHISRSDKRLGTFLLTARKTIS